MLLARVIGTVVASRKEAELEGLKLLLLRGCDLDGQPSGAPLVAADAVGAGVGEVVLYATGSSARQTKVTKDRPVDAVVMAIVDLVEADGRPRYEKARGP
ncbi:MAG: EutN/CcmL family microcompartment protein [Myxococcota bacterium]|nr:EutN/CcmL family microcompartment protein [Myxococcota bacterium]MDW8362406.1 EutN/CcmL family microcompartment protein [Myxococcales bacterium]